MIDGKRKDPNPDTLAKWNELGALDINNLVDDGILKIEVNAKTGEPLPIMEISFNPKNY